MRPYRRKRESTFGKLRNIWQAFPLSPEHRTAIEYWADARVPTVELLWPNVAPWVNGHPFNAYRNFRSNDAEVLDLEIKPGRLQITMEDIHLQDLAGVFADTGGHFSFPLQISFENLNEWKIFEVHPDGKLGMTRHSIGGKSRSLNDHIKDRIVLWTEDRVVGFFHFHQRSYKLRDRGYKREVQERPGMLVAIDAQQICIAECNRQRWSDYFGEEWAWLLDEFNAVRIDPSFYVWSVSEHVAFIEDCLRGRGLEWPEFS